MSFDKTMLRQLLHVAGYNAGSRRQGAIAVVGTSEMIGSCLNDGVASLLVSAGGLGDKVEEVERCLGHNRAVVLRTAGCSTQPPASQGKWKVWTGFTWPRKTGIPDLHLLPPIDDFQGRFKPLLDASDTILLFINGKQLSHGLMSVESSPPWKDLCKRRADIHPCYHCANYFTNEEVQGLNDVVAKTAIKRLQLPGNPLALFLSQDRNPGYQAIYLLERRLEESQTLDAVEAIEFLMKNGYRGHRDSASVFHHETIEELAVHLCEAT
jgi:hypothetical protein